MPDAGTLYTDKAQREIEKRIHSIYREAQADIVEKLNKQTKRMYALDAQKRAELTAGKITEKEYKDWLMGQMFTQKQWEDKLTSVAETLLHANEQANSVVEGKKRAVFGENATYQAYKLEKDAGLDLSFSIYDSATVTRLIKQRPELLPRKVVNGVKDKAWNRVNIANAISQGVIQGESIPDIAKRIARDTASENNKAMVRYARTAMTGAQNAGRMETLHEAVSMGIKVKKRWLATLDDRTRDAHAMLDGQVQDVDKPFESELGDIMYPGDMGADPANVWNCRCTLINEYVEYPTNADEGKRIAYDIIEDDEGNEKRVSYYVKDMDYKEWKGWKETKESSIINAEIDLITPCLIDAKTGAVVETVMRKIHPDEKMFKRWEFDWTEPERYGYEVEALYVKGKKEIEGLVSYKRDKGYYYLHLVEAAPQNNSHALKNRMVGKKYNGVGAHLFAEVCKKSYDDGFGGFVAFDAKTGLIEHYKKTLGAEQVGTSQRMFIDEKAAKKLIDTYFGGKK